MPCRNTQNRRNREQHGRVKEESRSRNTTREQEAHRNSNAPLQLEQVAGEWIKETVSRALPQDDDAQ